MCECSLLPAGTPALLPSWLVTPLKPQVPKAAAGGGSAVPGALKKATTVATAAGAAAAAAAKTVAAAVTAKALPVRVSAPPQGHGSQWQPLQGMQPPPPPLQSILKPTASGPDAASATAVPGGGVLPQCLLQPGVAAIAMKRPGTQQSAKPETGQQQPPWDASAAAAAPAAKKRRVNRYANIREQDRCGHCKTCLNRGMKKACLTRRAEADGIARAAQTGAARALPAPAAWSAAAPM